jgi:Ca2+-binding EF-hand superfamily protein
MKIKIWDDPMDYNKFEVCLHRLDPSFSDGQSKALFKKIKGPDDKVDIQVMLNNFAGTIYDTVDYRNKLFKSLYVSIYQKGNQDKLLKDLEAHDPKCDGKISPKDLEKVLKGITGTEYSDEELLKFTR